MRGLLLGAAVVAGCVQGDLVLMKFPGPCTSNTQQKVEPKPVETQPGEDKGEELYFWFEFAPEGEADVPGTDRAWPDRNLLPTDRI